MADSCLNRDRMLADSNAGFFVNESMMKKVHTIVNKVICYGKLLHVAM